MGQDFGQTFNLVGIITLQGTFEIGDRTLDISSGARVNMICVIRKGFVYSINQPIRCVAGIDQLFFSAVVFRMKLSIFDQPINFFLGQPR